MARLSPKASQQLATILQQHASPQRARIKELLACFSAESVERVIAALYPAPSDAHEHILVQGLRKAGIQPTNTAPAATPPNGTGPAASTSPPPRRKDGQAWAWLGWLRWSAISFWMATAGALAMWKLAVSLSLAACAASILTVMSSWEPEPLSFPVAYNYDAVFNETLRRGEDAAAALLSPAPAEPFCMEKLTRESDMVLVGMQRMGGDFLRLWPIETPNGTVRAYYKTLMEVINDFSGPGRRDLYGLDNKLSVVLSASSSYINSSVIAVADLLTMPADKLVQKFGPRRSLLATVARQLRLAQPIDPVRIRAAAMWAEVCDCQQTLTEMNDRLSAHCRDVQETLLHIYSRFGPVRFFMSEEVVQRKDEARHRLEGRLAAYNASLIDWQSDRANRWYNSTRFVYALLGRIMGGGKPPKLPWRELRAPERTIRDLEATEAHLLLTQAHVDFIRRLLHQVQLLLSESDSNRIDRGPNRGRTCALLQRGGAATADSRQSPQEVLLVLDKTVTDFGNRLRHWNATAFHEHIEELRTSASMFFAVSNNGPN
ncbi:hypothetical protein B0J12DRAFT_771126 [Macrophomina phaseolina]|uniref:Uncharacterized protein n=1 Tax=Macrophomina phaseolina TaxID=35725 RepID=A0ABQ8FU70_9PEZI|nr:hypothetical protein B0J12DRAFT_771126 [Macrophomina phaseolina]